MMGSDRWPRRLRSTAWCALVIHFVAGVTMALILRNGLASGADINSRLAFLVSERLLWVLGWLPWNLAALSILYLCFCFSKAHEKDIESPFVLKYAVIICGAGVLFDLSAQAAAMVLLPQLAALALEQPQQLPKFDNVYRLVVLSSGAAGNGAYTLATVICAWVTRAMYPKWITWSALVVGVLGMGVSLACIVDSVFLQIVLNALLLPALFVWLIGIARHRQP